MRFALDPGPGAASVPVWTSVLGVTLTIALLAGLWSFQTSLRHLLDTPHLYGWNWSVKSGAPALPDLVGLVDPGVRAGSDGLGAGRRHRHPGGAGLERVDVLGLKQEQGSTVAPTVLEGRLPKRPNEMVLGTSTLEKAGLHIGDIAVRDWATPPPVCAVVGRAVFPSSAIPGDSATASS